MFETRPSRREFLALTLAGSASLLRGEARADDELATRNVVLVTLDGLRPEEVFRGADEAFLTKKAGVSNPDRLRARFWRESPAERREALMPFLWKVVAREGQLFGNADRGSVARVTNGRNFSYPGYNEILTGAADDRVDSNDKRPNPNVNVLEWLQDRPGFGKGSAAAYGSWDVFPFILNRERSGLAVNAGWEPIEDGELTPRQVLLNDLSTSLPRHWDNVRYDALTFEAALEHLRKHRPRVLYLALGETDDYAHEGRHDLYLDSAFRSDAMLAKLWATLQGTPGYRGATSLIVTTDHGRGGVPDGWKGHGADVPGADRIWIAALGPDTPPLGERSDVGPVTQSQVAATVAALLGQDYRAEFPKAAPPLADVIRPGKGR